MKKYCIKISLLTLFSVFSFANLLAISELDKSKDFEVTINGKKVAVGVLPQFDIPIHTVHEIINEQQPIEIEINIGKKIETYAISPLSRKIESNVLDKVLTFSLSKPQYIVVKINEKEYLFIMLDSPSAKPANMINILDYGINNSGKEVLTKQIQQAIDDAANRNLVLYFPAGRYLTGQLRLANNSQIYLDKDACIKASTDIADFPDNAMIKLDNINNVKIGGYGTIDGSGYTGLRQNGGEGIHLIYISECKNISLDDLVLLDPCFWNVRVYRSENVHLKNLKILNNRPFENWINTDGVDFDSSINCSLTNSILHCGDDNLVVKGLDDERIFNTQNILFENITTLSNSAATKIGTETGVEEFSNIIFRNIDIIKCKRAMVINAYDSTYIKNVTFENINVESFDLNGVEAAQLVDFEITDNSWRDCVGDCVIDNVTIKNVNVFTDMEGVGTQLIGKDEKYAIRNIKMKNITKKGKVVKDGNDLNLSKNEYVFDLTLE